MHFQPKISNNPVQQYMYKRLLEHEQDTDDLYDVANLIAAMRKTAEAIFEGYKKRLDPANDSEDIIKLVEEAMVDWAGREDKTYTGEK